VRLQVLHSPHGGVARDGTGGRRDDHSGHGDRDAGWSCGGHDLKDGQPGYGKATGMSAQFCGLLSVFYN